MRTARLLAGVLAPVLVVACAVGAAPDGTGTGDDGDGGGAATNDSGYGTTGDGAPVTGDSGGAPQIDSGTKEGGAPPIDSGSPITGGAGLDCSGSNSSSGESYSDECDDLETESDCSSGGGECGAGTCCSAKFECYLDWFGPQCVPQ